MVRYPEKLYSREALLKASFAFTDSMYIHLDEEDGYYLVSLFSKDGSEDERNYKLFENELIAQETRRIVSDKTKNIREIIVARALSSTIISEDVDVGNDEMTDVDYNAEDILQDWFKVNGTEIEQKNI